uniref:Uncharacterized protein n=1 Tax=Arundo donax TaxID=35708 RepID=A0A0A9H2H1_ARUDO
MLRCATSIFRRNDTFKQYGLKLKQINATKRSMLMLQFFICWYLSEVISNLVKL